MYLAETSWYSGMGEDVEHEIMHVVLRTTSCEYIVCFIFADFLTRETYFFLFSYFFMCITITQLESWNFILYSCRSVDITVISL